MAIKSDFAADPATDTRDLAFVPADPALARTLRPEQVEHYNQRGYLSPLDAFDAEEIGSIRSYVDGLLESVLTADDRRNSYSINGYHAVCAGLYDLIKTPILLDYVEDILGPDFGCWGDHLFCKLPRDPMAVPLHQDSIYWPLSPTKTVSVWLALDDVDAENSAVEFVPGSHRLGALPHQELALDGTRVLKRQVVDPDRYGERVCNELKAGQVSLHSDMLLHGSSVNRSDRRRAGITLRYAAAEVTTQEGWAHWFKTAVHCRGTLPDYWGNWRRPEGERPERMAQYTGDFDGNVVDAG